jgi:hypothetical protein
MNPDGSSIPYPELFAIADRLFEECEDDVICLASRMELLDAGIRNDLLVSDILNSYQVFYYYFRTCPDGLVCEKLELEPASSLVKGVKIDEVELLELFFSVKNHEAVITVSDGEKTLVAFRGKNAYADGLKYIENPPY